MKPHLPLLLRKTLLAGVITILTSTLFGVAAYAESQHLIYSGEKLIWNTRTDNDVYIVDGSDTVASFSQGDSVSFIGTTQVRLGEDISVGIMSVNEDANVSLSLGSFSINAQEIKVSGSLDIGEDLYVHSGTTLSINSYSASLDSNLILGDGTLVVDGKTNLNSNELVLQGGTDFRIAEVINGRVHSIFTNISSLVGADGETLKLSPDNNKASFYFDASKPGTGFWANSTLELTDNGTLQLVRYTGTTKDSLFVNDRETGTIDHSYHFSVSYTNIPSDTNMGGALYGTAGSKIQLSYNGNVTLYSNTSYSSNSTSTAYSYGGAVYGGPNSQIKLSDNSLVGFNNNEARAASTYESYAYGGAVYSFSGGNIEISNNAKVDFSDNTVSTRSANSSSYDSKASYAYSYGGAIAGSGTIKLDNNDSVLFSNNTAVTEVVSSKLASSSYAYGGAIYADEGSNIIISNNRQVDFLKNSATRATYAYGGAIAGFIDSNIVIEDNNTINFKKNSSYGNASGGAVYGRENTISFINNRNVIFDENNSSDSGGAIACVSSSISLNSNDNVVIYKNTAANGGGVLVNGQFSLSGNDRVTFEANSATTNGGAIYGAVYYGSITLSNNGVVSFSGNTAKRGGAIQTAGSLIIRNNDAVLFEKNAETSDEGYILRSIYIDDYNDEEISFSAAKNKSIEFRDSIYIGSKATVNLNTQFGQLEQTGDIVFTGATTAADLYEVKGKVQGTDDEILASRTSEIKGATNLHGGCLRVEENAILKVSGGLNVTANSNATVRINNAILDAGINNYDGITLNGGKLELCNKGIISASFITVVKNATFATVSDMQGSSDTAGILNNTILPNSDIFNSEEGGTVAGNLILEAGSAIVADGAHFQMDDGSALTLAATSDEKIELWLTYGIEYGVDGKVFLFSDISSLTITLDGVKQDYSTPILANTIFEGEWINENTTLHFDDSVLFVQNVNYVDFIPEHSPIVPEPAAVTLSLMALCGLVVRRRRK